MRSLESQEVLGLPDDCLVCACKCSSTDGADSVDEQSSAQEAARQNSF